MKHLFEGEEGWVFATLLVYSAGAIISAIKITHDLRRAMRSR